MGGDSAMTNEDGDQSQRSPKVFERNGLLFGITGEMRVAQLIKYVYDVPAPADGQDGEEFLVREVCGGLRSFLREQASELLPELDDDEMWFLLVGLSGRLFRVCSHLSVTESVSGYDAIGSGTPQALGSLASTEGRPAEERVNTALRAAERHQSGVAGPFTVLTL